MLPDTEMRHAPVHEGTRFPASSIIGVLMKKHRQFAKKKYYILLICIFLSSRMISFQILTRSCFYFWGKFLLYTTLLLWWPDLSDDCFQSSCCFPSFYCLVLCACVCERAHTCACTLICTAGMFAEYWSSGRHSTTATPAPLHPATLSGLEFAKPLISSSQVAGATGLDYHTPIILIFFSVIWVYVMVSVNWQHDKI